MALASLLVFGERQLVDVDCVTLLEQYLMFYVFHRKSRIVKEYGLSFNDKVVPLVLLIFKRGKIVHFSYHSKRVTALFTSQRNGDKTENARFSPTIGWLVRANPSQGFHH